MSTEFTFKDAMALRGNPAKPKVQLSGQDGNIFNLLGLSARALRRAGQDDQAKAMYNDVQTNAKDYYEALAIIQKYVDAS